MDRNKERWTDISWGGGVTVLVALIVLIAAPGYAQRWAVIGLGIFGTILFLRAFIGQGWHRAPIAIGTPIRATIMFCLIAGTMFLLCWFAWPPIRRHVLDDDEKQAFEAPLREQAEDRYEIQLACPSADESTCVYAAQFINIFKEAGWKIQDYQVKRVTLGVPYDGVRIFSYVEKYPDPAAPPNIGVWTKISKSLITVYRSFHAIQIEPEQGIRNDLKENVLTVYFGSERADEGAPTSLTTMYGQLPQVRQQYPGVKFP
jgi:hypothetical protein